MMADTQVQAEPQAQVQRLSARMVWITLRLTWKEWSADNGAGLSAALAYYAVFSLAPILIIAIAVAGLVFGEDAARGELTDQISSFIGPQGAGLVQTMLVNASKPATGNLAGAIGLITLLFGATGAFSQMQSSFNYIWNVSPEGAQSLRKTATARAVAFLLVLGVGLLLLTMLILSAVISGLSNILGASLLTAQTWGQIINFIVSFGLTAVMFALLYKVLPDVDVAWRDVWVGAIITSILFTIGKQLIGIYLGRASVASAYGAAGSLVIIMLWAYYSAQILFLGAEFTQVYTRMFGSRRAERAMLTTRHDVINNAAHSARARTS